MKRWRIAFLVALLAAVGVMFRWDRSPALMSDTDTIGILKGIREAHDPLKWFRGDWPIENHFYRPVASLTFEADNALYHDNAAGYGFTNVLLCAVCVLLLFWFLREVTDRPLVAALGSALFALWHTSEAIYLSNWAAYAAWATLVVGVVRHRRDVRRYFPAFLTLLTLSIELIPRRMLEGRMIDWIPGRTASTMTVFALAALASYARFERLRPARAEKLEITPETPPATRNTEEAKTQGVAWPWAVLAAFFTAGALGSYEQAVMLPALCAVVAVAFWIRGYRPAWGLHAVFWALLVGYLGLRWGLLPHTVSGYQKQQYSSTRTAFWEVMSYLYPPLQGIVGLPASFDGGIYALFNTEMSGPYQPIWQAIVITTGYIQARKELVLLVVGLIGSTVAYLPMAWFKMFEHYHYWPIAMRSGFVVGLGLVAWRLALTAWCPPARLAPRRPHPAPGSLPRP